MDTLHRVWKVLEDWCEMPDGPIQPDLPIETLDLDSLTMLEISLGLDKEFGTEIPESDIKQARTVADLAALADANSPSTD
ncbi:acyl carrier protein [Streptomyces sp. NPDC088354]|uniref:acyl carrier protein n=1 Tax=Streptomyces sp. NPDC088354 TaxID=3365856 RepID=UPI003801F8DF